jgi:CRP/FNR family cyclic AMP-dependent transcriptional regulator
LYQAMVCTEAMLEFSDNPWFARLPKAEADALLGAATPSRLARGEFAFAQGDLVKSDSGAFFGITSGMLKLQILHPDGREAILAVIEPGVWLGEVAILDQLPRDYSAVALTACEVLAVSAEKFRALMQRCDFAQAIARQLASRLRLACGLMGDSALQPIRARVAQRLVLLAHGDITLSTDGRTCLSTSQETVALMLGVSRPTLNKELNAMAELGAITLRYGRIEINDIGLLQALGRSPD